jgi:hypothetical protein
MNLNKVKKADNNREAAIPLMIKKQNQKSGCC